MAAKKKEENKCEDCEACECKCHVMKPKLMGLLIGLLGLGLLLERFGGDAANLGRMWPALLVLAGAAHLLMPKCKCCCDCGDSKCC